MTLSLLKKVAIAEVGPRDGLQSFPRWIDTDTKVAIIDRLSDLGLSVIKVSSFAHPRVVPHLRDAEEVFERIRRRPGTVSAEDYRLMKRVAFFMGIHCSLTELDLAYARFIKETGSAQMYPLFGGSRRQALLWSNVMSSFDDLQQWLSHGARANLFREARTCYTDYEEWRLLQA